MDPLLYAVCVCLQSVVTMQATRTFLLLLAVATAIALPESSRNKRQLADDDSLQPLDDGQGADQTREKRKLEGVTQAKFGIKNAILGLVFGYGITSRRLMRSRRSTSKDSSTSPTSRDKSSTVTTTPSQRGSGLSQNNRLPRQSPTTADGIPIFDRNKVSLDFPGNLFGPSVSLLIKTTKIVGDVIQNSAVRYQTFLRLFRPLFRGQFEIKGLDPPPPKIEDPKTNSISKRANSLP